jgi:HAD superfamily phosphatase (TIGR01668 family)
MPGLFYPDIALKRVWDIRPELLLGLGIKALLLDIDNTLTTHGNPEPIQKAVAWLKEINAAGINAVLVSNNRKERVEAFAEGLGAGFVFRSLKPLPVGFRRAARSLRLKPGQFAVVGDQIFTDILGGRLFGAKTVLLEPIEPEPGPFFRLKRRLEARIRRKLKGS